MSQDPRIEVVASVFAEVTGEPRVGRFERTMATAAVAAIDKAAPDVLVDDSWIPVAELPAVLGNFMRLSDQYAQDAKAMYARAEAAEAKVAAVRGLTDHYAALADSMPKPHGTVTRTQAIFVRDIHQALDAHTPETETTP